MRVDIEPGVRNCAPQSLSLLRLSSHYCQSPIEGGHGGLYQGQAEFSGKMCLRFILMFLCPSMDQNKSLIKSSSSSYTNAIVRMHKLKIVQEIF